MQRPAQSCSRQTSRARGRPTAGRSGKARVRPAAGCRSTARVRPAAARCNWARAARSTGIVPCLRGVGAMRRAARCSSTRPTGAQDGFTLLEILAGLLIMSILGVSIWGGVSACIRVTSRIHDTALASTRILAMDDTLRNLAGRIRAPYWASEYLIENAEGEMRIAYLDGDPAKSMVLKMAGGALSVFDGVTTYAYQGFAGVSAQAAADKDGNVFGISVTVEEKGRAPFSITARFGSAPVMKGAAQ